MALTILCTVAAGAVLAGAWHPRFGLGLTGSVVAAGLFFADVWHGAWRHFGPGWAFALPLLGFLAVHELGHYFAARRHGIDVSLPVFLPIPPSLSPVGSLGAFIRVRSAVRDRPQLLDLGASGPLAGFVVALGLLAWGYAISEPAAIGPATRGDFVIFAGRPLFLGDSLLTHALRHLILGDVPAVYLSLPAFAGWVGALLTALNLLPLSQLDGGHVLYALLGRRQAAVGFVTLLALLWLGRYWWSWYAWVAIALVVGRGGWRHPTVVEPETPLSRGRRWVAWVSVAVFVVTFVPIPVR